MKMLNSCCMLALLTKAAGVAINHCQILHNTCSSSPRCSATLLTWNAMFHLYY